MVAGRLRSLSRAAILRGGRSAEKVWIVAPALLVTYGVLLVALGIALGAIKHVTV